MKFLKIMTVFFILILPTYSSKSQNEFFLEDIFKESIDYVDWFCGNDTVVISSNGKEKMVRFFYFKPSGPNNAVIHHFSHFTRSDLLTLVNSQDTNVSATSKLLLKLMDSASSLSK